MSIEDLHPWTNDVDEAIRLQENLHDRLVLTWDERPVNTIGGVDVSFVGNTVRAAIAVCRYPDLAPLGAVTGEAPLVFPYIAGLLAFRVGPAILAAWEKLPQKPDLLLLHGHGIAHPRGIGLASHIGLWLNLPTIGFTKSRLYGCHTDVGPQAGAWSELHDERDPKHVMGAVLRTRLNTKPVYVSPGHLIDLPNAVMFVLTCCRGYRMPEPLRRAHQIAFTLKQTDV